ncbi:hypothetical protein AVEN_255211-1 [Araneus ventricosus]|uniref:BEN domain-containing protein n=1 Tax=Araneus ventricosus TaxID=182803 RepID=A0A4Y2BAJ6_ARAVE|nr:hypothetical protein AVEN_255211-1 [Araneus ventricosus]
MKFRNKNSALKAKYKALKRQVKSEGGIDSEIENSTLVEKNKLNMCRLSCVSKFVSDLLDVVFGRDVLANNSMKGIKGSSKPPLAENILNDVMPYTCEKFTVDVGTLGDTSLYLTLFERQARAVGIEEEEWVAQLISLLPLELAQIIIKEPEEKMRYYVSVREVLLNRFKMKPETFRLKFTQHQRKSGALWKELVFELGNYLEGWVDGLDVKDFKSLKNLMIADQVKRRMSHDIKDHFLDEWGDLIHPLELAGKLDQYESGVVVKQGARAEAVR